jgi:two-component system alkaline phosphatase synthesis response regulator PhoP
MSGKRRVLLVEDEASIVKMISKRLEVSGFDVLVATNGQDGLTKARLGHPDVILLDLMLPKMSGLEICAALKQDEHHRHIPIIVFTGKGSPMDEQLCRECGAEAYINKPQGSKALLEQLEVLLSRVMRPAHVQGVGDQQSPPGST